MTYHIIHLSELVTGRSSKKTGVIYVHIIIKKSSCWPPRRGWEKSPAYESVDSTSMIINQAAWSIPSGKTWPFILLLSECVWQTGRRTAQPNISQYVVCSTYFSIDLRRQSLFYEWSCLPGIQHACTSDRIYNKWYILLTPWVLRRYPVCDTPYICIHRYLVLLDNNRKYDPKFNLNYHLCSVTCLSAVLCGWRFLRTYVWYSRPYPVLSRSTWKHDK